MKTNRQNFVYLTIAIAKLALAASASAGSFPAGLDISSLLPANGGDGTRGVAFDDNALSEITSVGRVGDINADGIDDVLVGMPRRRLPNFGGFAGGGYVVYGTDDGFVAQLDVQTLLPENGGSGETGFVMQGFLGTILGESVSGNGDINADGIADLLLGGSYFTGTPGATIVGGSVALFGRTAPFAAEFPLSALAPSSGGDGSQGFLINQNDNFDSPGGGANIIGDINGDGHDDLLFGVPRQSPTEPPAGHAYIIYGSSIGFPANIAPGDLDPANGGDGSVGFVMRSNSPVSALGRVTSRAGDVNADGIDDFLVSAPLVPNGNFMTAGATYLIFGSDQGFDPVFELSDLETDNGGDGTRGVVIRGSFPSDRSGWQVGGAGDINGDTISDIVIGTNGGQGGAYIIYGRADGFPAEYLLRTLSPEGGGDGSEGFLAQFGFRSLEGGAVGVDGDLNGDGVDDLLLGEPDFDDEQSNNTGAVIVLYGTTGGFPALVDLRSLLPLNGGNGDAGFVIRGSPGSQKIGRQAAFVGDVNADGIDDLLIGKTSVIAGSQTYLLFGRSAAADDGDADGVPDVQDNCINVANALQRDTDGDGFGNLCDADVNNDCVVNVVDLGVFRTVFFDEDDDADINGDGVVNFVDLGYLALQFFGPPGPSALAVCD